MQARQVRRIPVVDAAGALCGIVAMADLARKVPREAGEAITEVSQPSRAA
jgi:CBS-domain-containing membrane protein